MTREIPHLSNLRKAVENTAEKIALREKSFKPEKNEYAEALNFYRFLKVVKPGLYQEAVSISSRNKELKNKLNKKQYDTLFQVWKELSSGGEKEINKKLTEIYQDTKLSSFEIMDISEDFLNKKLDELKNDSRIKNAFSGHEELINSASILLKRSYISSIYFMVFPDGILNSTSNNKANTITEGFFESAIKYFQSLV